MFYLKEFFKLIQENLLIGSLFVLSTLSFVIVSWQQETIAIAISSVQKSISTPYFNALITERSDLVAVTRKMKSLPGVLAVSFQGDSELKKEMDTLKATFGTHVLNHYSPTSFKNMRIELESGIQLRSQSLIREYLARLVGKDNVTMSKIKTPKLKDNEKTTLMGFIIQWGNKYLLVTLALFWMFCLYLFLRPLKSYAYIIEKFQRKVSVVPKVMISGVCVLIFASMITNYFAFSNTKIGMITYIAPISMLIISFLFSTSFSRKERVSVR